MSFDDERLRTWQELPSIASAIAQASLALHYLEEEVFLNERDLIRSALAKLPSVGAIIKEEERYAIYWLSSLIHNLSDADPFKREALERLIDAKLRADPPSL